MDADDHTDQYLELCKRIFNRMSRERSFPWMTDPELWNREHPDHMVGTQPRKLVDEVDGMPESPEV